MTQQSTLMKFDPATGWSTPYPSHAQQWREFNGATAWLFNPWTGERRTAEDVGSDTFGHLILPPGEQIVAAPSTVKNYPICQACGADRRQEGCKGDMLTCAIRGTAQKGEPT